VCVSESSHGELKNAGHPSSAAAPHRHLYLDPVDGGLCRPIGMKHQSKELLKGPLVD